MKLKSIRVHGLNLIKKISSNFILQLFFLLGLGFVLGMLFRFYPKKMSALYLNPNHFKFLGSMFISMVRMLVGPLVFTSVFTSIASMGDAKKTSRLFIFSMFVFLAMTVISVLISIFVVNYLKLGSGIVLDISSLASSNNISNIAKNAISLNSFGDFILALIPSNVNEAFRTDNFLHIIFFSSSLAFASMVIGSKAEPFVKFTRSFGDILLHLSSVFGRFAPFAVFSFAFYIVGTQEIGLLKSLLKFVGAVYGVCGFIVYILYPAFAFFVLRLNPFHIIKKMLPLQIVSYFLSSSSAVLPRSLDIAEKDLGVSNSEANFVIPVGATLNMNGGAVYMSAATLFVAQLFGVELSLSQYLLLIILSTVSAIGTAPIPGSGIFLLSGILLSLDLPIEAIGIMLAIDRILDMARTVTNVTGDVFSSVIISSAYGNLDRSVYKK